MVIYAALMERCACLFVYNTLLNRMCTSPCLNRHSVGSSNSMYPLSLLNTPSCCAVARVPTLPPMEDVTQEPLRSSHSVVCTEVSSTAQMALGRRSNTFQSPLGRYDHPVLHPGMPCKTTFATNQDTVLPTIRGRDEGEDEHPGSRYRTL